MKCHVMSNSFLQGNKLGRNSSNIPNTHDLLQSLPLCHYAGEPQPLKPA